MPITSSMKQIKAKRSPPPSNASNTSSATLVSVKDKFAAAQINKATKEIGLDDLTGRDTTLKEETYTDYSSKIHLAQTSPCIFSIKKVLTRPMKAASTFMIGHRLSQIEYLQSMVAPEAFSVLYPVADVHAMWVDLLKSMRPHGHEVRIRAFKIVMAGIGSMEFEDLAVSATLLLPRMDFHLHVYDVLRSISQNVPHNMTWAHQSIQTESAERSTYLTAGSDAYFASFERHRFNKEDQTKSTFFPYSACILYLTRIASLGNRQHARTIVDIGIIPFLDSLRPHSPSFLSVVAILFHVLSKRLDPDRDKLAYGSIHTRLHALRELTKAIPSFVALERYSSPFDIRIAIQDAILSVESNPAPDRIPEWSSLQSTTQSPAVCRRLLGLHGLMPRIQCSGTRNRNSAAGEQWDHVLKLSHPLHNQSVREPAFRMIMSDIASVGTGDLAISVIALPSLARVHFHVNEVLSCIRQDLRESYHRANSDTYLEAGLDAYSLSLSNLKCLPSESIPKHLFHAPLLLYLAQIASLGNHVHSRILVEVGVLDFILHSHFKISPRLAIPEHTLESVLLLLGDDARRMIREPVAARLLLDILRLKLEVIRESAAYRAVELCLATLERQDRTDVSFSRFREATRIMALEYCDDAVHAGKVFLRAYSFQNARDIALAAAERRRPKLDQILPSQSKTHNLPSTASHVAPKHESMEAQAKEIISRDLVNQLAFEIEYLDTFSDPTVEAVRMALGIRTKTQTLQTYRKSTSLPVYEEKNVSQSTEGVSQDMLDTLLAQVLRGYYDPTLRAIGAPEIWPSHDEQHLRATSAPLIPSSPLPDTNTYSRRCSCSVCLRQEQKEKSKERSVPREDTKKTMPSSMEFIIRRNGVYFKDGGKEYLHHYILENLFSAEELGDYRRRMNR
ncbi:hypothetical protein Moror_4472 [Moniliophthora roreri MCA 2997]|uniref:Uncharacterized protein n=1 Tax=Moniliophthora roreri (strain MCA 2997) TaxID=1381753 RepID=V2XIT5_MONRO|nr:hypothetical protein Moror_4472 [Moniliophthora roreri MCA 2997]